MQKVVSRSSAESEYRGLSNAAAEIAWIQSILTELGVSCSAPPLLLCDNVSATYMSVNPVMHSRTKHIEVDHHFIREKVGRKQLLAQFVPSEDQVANIFTKSLHSPRFIGLRTKLTLVSKQYELAGDVNTIYLSVFFL